MRKIVSILLAVVMVASLSMVASAAWQPSVTMQDKVEVKDAVATDAKGNAVAVEVVAEVETPADTVEAVTKTKHINEIKDRPVIKVTPVAMTLAANKAADNTDLADDEKADASTSTGIGYAANQALNDVYQAATSAASTSEFVESFGAQAVAAAEAAVAAVAGDDENKGDINNYAPATMFDISANDMAKEAVGKGGKITVTVNVDGASADSTLITQHVMDNGEVEYLDTVAGDGTATFDIDPSNLSPFVILTYVAPAAEPEAAAPETEPAAEPEAPATEAPATEAPAADVAEPAAESGSSAIWWIVAIVVVAVIVIVVVSNSKKKKTSVESK